MCNTVCGSGEQRTLIQQDGWQTKNRCIRGNDKECKNDKLLMQYADIENSTLLLIEFVVIYVHSPLRVVTNAGFTIQSFN